MNEAMETQKTEEKRLKIIINISASQ